MLNIGAIKSYNTICYIVSFNMMNLLPLSHLHDGICTHLSIPYFKSHSFLPGYPGRVSSPSPITHYSQSGEAYWWRVCYQRGLPRLVSSDSLSSRLPRQSSPSLIAHYSQTTLAWVLLSSLVWETLGPKTQECETHFVIYKPSKRQSSQLR